MAPLTAAVRWLRARLLPSLPAAALAALLVYCQLAQSRAQARLTEAQQRLQAVQAQAARVEQLEKKVQSSQQLLATLQQGLLSGDLYYGRLSAIQRAERESGARVVAFTPGQPEAIGAAPVQQPPGGAPAPQSAADQRAGAAGQPAAPAPAQPAPAAGSAAVYKRYPVQVAAQGSYSQVLAFLRSLEHGSPVARVGAMEFSTGGDKGASVTATVYFYGP